ncbi:paraquat-inducible membrane protein A [Rhodobacteraceae bacterium 2CG4]|uniref:Paraquat-inducible membrane protein A n=1 Tax=Halovulum marinum TaxID=2662447 RepID=A0A6L5YX35_9RHOB|nr:paraquat-inducible membrane protein A [Halovulum marinum]
MSARDAGLVACTRCTRVWPQGQARCGRCGSRLRSRDLHSMQRVWAWWAAGLLAYVPANLYPMLRTHTLFTTQENTIVGGAVELAAGGSLGVAAVILIASVAIPVGKFGAIAFLAISIHGRQRHSGHRRHRLYEMVEFVGRWSMIDVFVVAILSALVQLGSLVSIRPGPAAVTFALSVVFTMLSAQSFDSRLIFDQTGQEQDAA